MNVQAVLIAAVTALCFGLPPAMAAEARLPADVANYEVVVKRLNQFEEKIESPGTGN